jgi:hypothetical protein
LSLWSVEEQGRKVEQSRVTDNVDKLIDRVNAKLIGEATAAVGAYMTFSLEVCVPDGQCTLESGVYSLTDIQNKKSGLSRYPLDRWS